MKDTNYIFRRIGAYIIDGVVVAVLTTLIASIGFINPYKAKNDEMTKKYSDLYKDSIQVVSDISKYLEDDKISVEELAELKNQLENAQLLFNSQTNLDLIDSCIYQIDSLEAKYNYLIKEARKKGIKNDIEYSLAL